MDPFIPYAAGIFDGEGTVGINLLKRAGKLDRFALRVGIGMTCPDAVLLMKERFGGSMHINHHEKKNKNHRPQFTWVISSSSGAEFLRAIQPYCVVKRLEVEVALEFQDNVTLWSHKLRGHSPLRKERWWTHPEAAEVIAQRLAFKKKLTELKHLTYSLPS